MCECCLFVLLYFFSLFLQKDFKRINLNILPYYCRLFRCLKWIYIFFLFSTLIVHSSSAIHVTIRTHSIQMDFGHFAWKSCCCYLLFECLCVSKINTRGVVRRHILITSHECMIYIFYMHILRWLKFVQPNVWLRKAIERYSFFSFQQQ